jgi:hypothetical protein
VGGLGFPGHPAAVLRERPSSALGGLGAVVSGWRRGETASVVCLPGHKPGGTLGAASLSVRKAPVSWPLARGGRATARKNGWVVVARSDLKGRIESGMAHNFLLMVTTSSRVRSRGSRQRPCVWDDDKRQARRAPSILMAVGRSRIYGKPEVQIQSPGPQRSPLCLETRPAGLAVARIEPAVARRDTQTSRW